MKRCLVVDDSRVIRRVAAKIVQDLGFEVAEADNGPSAISKCAAKMPDVVLLDWDMPGMDGLVVARSLRKMPAAKKLAIVFCTTRNEPSEIREALEAGVDEYIMKPFDSEIVGAKFLLLGLLP